ncbi:TraC family protein, partial [Escherichia coli]|nr:TraC family protein [Escherichia coli]
GVRCTRMNGLQVHGWLLRLFNPRPEWVDRDTLYRLATRAAPQEAPEGMMPVMTDFAESLWFTPPVSDPENGVWW